MRITVLACIAACIATGAVAQSAVERGRYLVETIAACGNCHTPKGPDGPLQDKPLAGGLVVDVPSFTAVMSNITPDIETGIGGWTDDQIATAIREGQRPDGSLIGPPMPFSLYRRLADDDVRAMVAYLRTVPAVRNSVPKSTYRMKLPERYGPPVNGVAAPAKTDQVAYGAYLAGPVAHCIACHTPLLPGGAGIDMSRAGAGGGRAFSNYGGSAVPSNITPRGLGAWTDSQIDRAIRDGISADGRKLVPIMAFTAYRDMTPEDMTALIAYLRSLPPVE